MEASKKAHENLESWRLGRRLVNRIYDITAGFPDHEKYGLVSQLRRASLSIPSQIAEGAAQKTTKNYIRYLYMARGSCSEIRTQLIIAADRQFAPRPDLKKVFLLQRKVESKLTGQIKALEKKE